MTGVKVQPKVTFKKSCRAIVIFLLVPLQYSSFFLHAPLKQIPTECVAGTASLGGSQSCTPCASGTYTDAVGAIACISCPAGSSCSDTSANPVTCFRGTYSLEGEAECSACATGTYSVAEASSCLSCPVGYSCSDPSIDPILCTDGYYSEGGNVRRHPLCTHTDTRIKQQEDSRQRF